MINLDETLCYSSIHTFGRKTGFWVDMLNDMPFDGQWYIKISSTVTPMRHISRNGEWSMPWPQKLIPKFAMPKYDPTFNKSFEQVTDENALRIKQRVQQGEKFGIMWSGGIDSTVILVALLKNLTSRELENIYVLYSGESIIEYPDFFRKFIHNKLKTFDSRVVKYDNLLDMDITPITGDEGDCIFGTVIGLNMYNNFDALLDKIDSPNKDNLKSLRNKISNSDIHYSTFKDLIIQYLDIPWHKDFGRILYEKYDLNVRTADVPVHSLHDFFWWLIFNVKYLNCSIRGALHYNYTLDWKVVMDRMVNWYNDTDYQLWSMVNNNNGTKIKNHILSYKESAKKYIYDFDRNIWYYTFKHKVDSLWNLTYRSNERFPNVKSTNDRIAAKFENYELLYMDDPEVEKYFRHHLSNYKIDWTEVNT